MCIRYKPIKSQKTAMNTPVAHWYLANNPGTDNAADPVCSFDRKH